MEATKAKTDGSSFIVVTALGISSRALRWHCLRNEAEQMAVAIRIKSMEAGCGEREGIFMGIVPSDIGTGRAPCCPKNKQTDGG